MENVNRSQPLFSTQEVGVTINLLRERWLFLVFCTLAGAGLGAAYLLVSTPTLEFAARVLVLPHDRPLDENRKFADDKEFLPTQAEIIRSPAVIERVIDQPGPREQAGPAEQTDAEQSDAEQAGPTEQAEPAEQSGPAELTSPLPVGEMPTKQELVQDLIGRLSAHPLLGTNVISLRLQDGDAEKGLQTLSAVITSYQEYLQTTEQSSHRETISLLFERERQLREEIADLQSQYSEMHNKGPLVGQDSNAAEPRARLEAVKLQLIDSRTRRIRIASYLEQLVSLNDSVASSDLSPISTETAELTRDSTGMSSDAAMAASMELVSRMDQEGLVRLQDPLTQQALLDARAQEAGLSQKFGERHPDVRGVRSLIQSLEDEMRETLRVAPRILQNELDAIRSQETELSAAYQQEFGHCKELDAAVIREQHVLDQIKSVQTIHDTVLSQINRFELADEAITNGQSSITVRVLDSPQMLEGQTWPQPAPVLALAIAMGLAAGCLLVICSHWLKLQRSSDHAEPTGALQAT